ncbi:MAG: hypothetical protein ABH803_04430 [Candidatus Micrarchaeota archaeon]
MNLVSEIKNLETRFAAGDILGLRELSKEAAIEAYVNNEPSLVELGVISYSCAKFLEKHYIVSSSEWNSFKESLLRLLAQARVNYSENNVERGRSFMHSAIILVEGLSSSIGRFASSVIEKGRIKIGADMYARGASLGIASTLSGVDKKELGEYIGITRILEKYSTKNVSERMSEFKKLV